MHKVAYWLTPLIALGVAFFLIVLLYTINQGEASPGSLQKSTVALSPKEQTLVESGWLERFSQSERHGYFFPVNEIYINIDLNRDITLETTYQLKATIKDPYQLFCLKEELKHAKWRYFLQQDKSGTLLLIQSKEIDRLQKFVETLKNYHITATVLPFKEEEEWKSTK
ncbi:MAG: hypothetical protein JXK05_03655 [Campylobacterales bacterium]|nr:hypothetical protein [Campylobacterales bacterium]